MLNRGLGGLEWTHDFQRAIPSHLLIEAGHFWTEDSSTMWLPLLLDDDSKSAIEEAFVLIHLAIFMLVISIHPGLLRFFHIQLEALWLTFIDVYLLPKNFASRALRLLLMIQPLQGATTSLLLLEKLTRSHHTRLVLSDIEHGV